MSIFDNWIMQAILIDEALDSLQKLDKEDSDSDMQDIIHCCDCKFWNRNDKTLGAGRCEITNSPVIESDFCSRAEKRKPKKVEFTDEEKQTAKFLDRMGIHSVEYNAKCGAFTLYNEYGVVECKTTKDVFPTIKKSVTGTSACEFVLTPIFEHETDKE